MATLLRRGPLVTGLIAGFVLGITTFSLLVLAVSLRADFSRPRGKPSAANLLPAPAQQGAAYRQATASRGDSPCDFSPARDWEAIPVPKCAKWAGEARSFMMFFMGDSASTAITAGVLEHSRVYHRMPEILENDLELIEMEDGAENQLTRIRRYFHNASLSNQIPGFKVRPGHTAALAPAIKDYRPRFIWNYRRNSIARAIGRTRKQHLSLPPGGFRDGTKFEETCSELGQCTIRLDIPELIEKMKSVMIDDVNITRAMHEVNAECILPVAYEDFSECPDRTFAQIFKFLGLSYQYYPPARSKTSTELLCDMVENWDEVCNTFMSCRDLRWQLETQFSCKCLNVPPHLLVPEKCPFETSYTEFPAEWLEGEN